MNKCARDEKWEKIEADYGTEVATALRMLYDYYDGEGIASWVVSLFDPERGGFYYSKSARDTDGYLPDLESTSQALSVLSEIGAVPTDKLNEILPESVRAGIVEFARELQSPVDGYFYHPQWPSGKENLNTDRYGRDVQSASSIFHRVKYDKDGDGVAEQQYPKYCMIDGRRCREHLETEEKCVFPKNGAPIPEPMQNKTEEAPKPSANHPVYTSESDFLAWLTEYNSTIFKDSGRAHNLAALVNEIAIHGYQNVLIDYLDDKQEELYLEQVRLGEEPTGIWQRNIDYRAVWGVYKYLYLYNNYGRAISLKYVPLMVETCLKVISLPPLQNYAFNDLMNQWSAISEIMANVERHHGKEEAEKILDTVRENAAELVRNSLAKMLPFKMEDGSFCNSVKGVTTPVIYGTPIAVGGIAEGNMNATHILLRMYFSICRVLGCTAVPLCDLSVGERVARLLASKIQ